MHEILRSPIPLLPAVTTCSCSCLGRIKVLLLREFFMENHKSLLLLNRKYSSAFHSFYGKLYSPIDGLQTPEFSHLRCLPQLWLAWVVCILALSVFRSKSPSLRILLSVRTSSHPYPSSAHTHTQTRTHSLINIASIFLCHSTPRRERPGSTGCTALLDQ